MYLEWLVSRHCKLVGSLTGKTKARNLALPREIRANSAKMVNTGGMLKWWEPRFRHDPHGRVSGSVTTTTTNYKHGRKFLRFNVVCERTLSTSRRWHVRSAALQAARNSCSR